MSKDFQDQIETVFASHSVSEEQAAHMEIIRDMCRSLAFGINDFCPNGREKSLAITNLEQVMFWANAGIAREQPEGGKHDRTNETR